MSNALQEAVHSPVSRRTLAVHVHGNPKQPLEQAAGVPNAESSHVSDGLTAAAPTGVVSMNFLQILCVDCVSFIQRAPAFWAQKSVGCTVVDF